MNMTREEAIKALRIEGVEIGGEAKRLVEFMVALDVAQKALRPVSLEQVEKVWRGKWVPEMNCFSVAAYHTCSKCGGIAETVETGDEQLSDFCPFCGAPMTDEAVEITMRRLEVLNEEDRPVPV